MWSNIATGETAAAIKLSVEMSAIVVVVNAFAGTAVAWLLVREKFFLNAVIGPLVDLPFALPTVVAGVTLLTVYGPGSPLHVNIAFSQWSILVALAFVTLPFSVRSVQPVLEALDVEAEEAAASLGASGFTTFTKIILPSLMPAILTGAGLAFARAIGEYGSVSLISGNVPFKTEVASVRIYGLIESDNLPAAAVSLALFVIAIVVLALFSLARRHFLPKGASRDDQDRTADLRRRGWSTSASSSVFRSAPSPTARSSPGSAAHGTRCSTPAGAHALVLTLEEAAVAVALDTVFGVGIALVLARHRFRGAGILELIIDMPLALSPVVIGLALVLFYSSTEGWIGPWLSDHGISVIFSFPGIVAASAFISLPYVVREILPVLQELGTEQEQAAETLGAGPWRVFTRITLPAIRWGLAYGVLLTTARVLGEFGAVSVVSGNIVGHTQTLTQFVDDPVHELQRSRRLRRGAPARRSSR